MRWFLLTDRKLTSYRLYGPFSTPGEADELGAKLFEENRIKSWAIIVAQVQPQLNQKGQME